MNLLKEFEEKEDDTQSDILDSVINTLINNDNFCEDCKQIMELDYQCHKYICPKCHLMKTYHGPAVTNSDYERKVTISANGRAFLSGDIITVEESVRKELGEMNSFLYNALTDDILEKIYVVLVVIRHHFDNRGKIRNSVLANCTKKICKKHKILISDDEIDRACGVTNKKINDGVKIMDFARFSGVIDEDDEDDGDDTEIELDIILKKLAPIEFSANQRNLILLYIRQYQNMIDKSRKPASLIAGAIWYATITIGLKITKEQIHMICGVSVSTFADSRASVANELADLNSRLAAKVLGEGSTPPPL